MKAVHKIAFRADIIREYSAIPEVDQLGEHDCTMELYTDDGTIPFDGSGTIEWIVGKNEEEVVHIGVWWQQKRLTDYDGIMGYLPAESKPLFEKAGLIVGDSFFADPPIPEEDEGFECSTCDAKLSECCRCGESDNKTKFITIIDNYAYFRFMRGGTRLQPQISINCNATILSFMDRYFNRFLPEVNVNYKLSNNQITIQNIDNVSMLINHIYKDVKLNKKKFKLVKNFLDRRKEQNRKHYTKKDYELVDKINLLIKTPIKKEVYVFDE